MSKPGYRKISLNLPPREQAALAALHAMRQDPSVTRMTREAIAFYAVVVAEQPNPAGSVEVSVGGKRIIVP
jgi:hypothetical protein